MRYSGFRYTLAICIAIVLVFSSPFALPAKAQETYTVLELYVQWQNPGPPEEVRNFYFDTETKKLIVTLAYDSQDFSRQLQEQVIDSEQLTILFEAPPDGNESDANSKRVKGALALLSGYLAAMAILAIFLFSKSKLKRSKATDNDSLPQQSGKTHSPFMDFFSATPPPNIKNKHTNNNDDPDKPTSTGGYSCSE